MKVPHYFGPDDLDARRSGLVHGWLATAAEYTYSAGRARVHHAARGDSVEHYAVSKRSFML